MDSTFMTTKEVSEKLGVHQMTVYRWIKEGLLPARYLPRGGIRVELKEFEKLLSQRKGETDAKRAV